MTEQCYTSNVARERMAQGNCPECGEPPSAHSESSQFWLRPSGCDLLPVGVTNRIAQYESDLKNGAVNNE